MFLLPIIKTKQFWLSITTNTTKPCTTIFFSTCLLNSHVVNSSFLLNPTISAFVSFNYNFCSMNFQCVHLCMYVCSRALSRSLSFLYFCFLLMHLHVPLSLSAKIYLAPHPRRRYATGGGGAGGDRRGPAPLPFGRALLVVDEVVLRRRVAEAPVAATVEVHVLPLVVLFVPYPGLLGLHRVRMALLVDVLR